MLKELFQLDQPNLDFGLYRIMHAKSAEVSLFLDNDLLQQVKAAFGQYKTADKAELEKKLSELIASIEAAGMNPDDSPKFKDLRARLQPSRAWRRVSVFGHNGLDEHLELLRYNGASAIKCWYDCTPKCYSVEERSARDRLSQSQCRAGWSPRISRTPLGFELSAPFAFSDTSASSEGWHVQWERVPPLCQHP